MARLRHSDIQVLLKCVRDLYSCTNSESFSYHALAALSPILPASHITYDVIDIKDNKISHSAVPCPAPPELLPMFEMFLHEHPWINFFSPQGPSPHSAKNRSRANVKPPLGSALKMSDALPDVKFQKLALYNEFYRCFNIEYQLLVPLLVGSRTLIGVTFNRDRRDYSEEERLMLNILGPHIVQAFMNAEAISLLEKKVADLEEALGGGRKGHIAGSQGITKREAQVLHYVAMGKTNTEVAVILGITPSTVKTHLERIYKKLGVENRTAASLLAFETLKLP